MQRLAQLQGQDLRRVFLQDDGVGTAQVLQAEPHVVLATARTRRERGLRPGGGALGQEPLEFIEPGAGHSTGCERSLAPTTHCNGWAWVSYRDHVRFRADP